MFKNKLVLVVLIIVFLVSIFLSAFTLKPQEETYYLVGYVLNTKTGQTYALYSEKEININWNEFDTLQIRLVIPREQAKDRTSVVFYTRYGR